jgi:hypothetical protein
MKLWEVEMQLHIFWYLVSGKEFQVLISKRVGTSKTGVAAVEKRKLLFFFQELHPSSMSCTLQLLTGASPAPKKNCLI